MRKSGVSVRIDVCMNPFFCFVMRVESRMRRVWERWRNVQEIRRMKLSRSKTEYTFEHGKLGGGMVQVARIRIGSKCMSLNLESAFQFNSVLGR